MAILLLEDNGRLAALVSDCLQSADYKVDCVRSISDFYAYKASFHSELYLMDLGLPDGDGLLVIKDIRSKGDFTPVLVITARADISDRVCGLRYGADDYLVKPFHQLELVARVKAVLRRPPLLSPQHICVGNVSMDVSTGEITCHGQPAHIRRSERRLLSLLLRRVGRLLSRRAIEDELITIDRDVTSNAVEKTVSRLRAALARDDAGLEIATIKGEGYILKERR
jgi:DNA-binding response OmpR family regulator